MPNLNGQSIADITFIDSLNGFAVTSLHYILKTTNGGDNWTVIYNDITGNIFKRVKFLNLNTGFVGGSIIINSLYYILKTTNAGLNWFYINAPFQSTYQDDMSILNEDTIWTVMSESLTGGVFHTTNGGVSWTQQLNLGSLNPDHIYMFNSRIGFIGEYGGPYLRKTIDGGITWFIIDSGGFNGFMDMYFIDSLTGWRAISFMKKTTDGGLSWLSQTLPYGGSIISTGMIKFSNVNKDTIWGVGGQIHYGIQSWGIIYKTTNGGNNWGFQLPDTTIHYSGYDHIKFVNKLNGWAGGPSVHTMTGGDTVTFLGIQIISKEIPKTFILKQNYPNPFNPRTVIDYELRNTSYVRLIVYDITGREVQKLVDQKQSAGEYEVDFMGKFVSSGVYLYRMLVTDEKGNATFSDTKKMILLK
jgi:photosystem II stability/assembly factor-like uncharacterized protein